MSASLAGLLVVALGSPTMVEQEPQIACGPNSLLAAAALLDREVATDEMVRACRGDADRVMSLRELRDIAERLGFATRLVSFGEMAEGAGELPVVVSLTGTTVRPDEPHFVVVYGLNSKRAQLVDYPWEPQVLSTKVLRRHWTGEGLVVARNKDELVDLDEALKGQRVRRIAGVGFLCIAMVGLAAPFLRRRRTEGTVGN